MSAVPCIGNYILMHESSDSSKNIVFSIAGPSSFLSGLIGVPFPAFAVGHVDYVVQERQMQFAQVCVLNWPVIHLNIDV